MSSEEKNKLRESVLASRLTLSLTDVAVLSALICEKLIKSQFWPKTGRVALYSSVKNEVMTNDLFQKAIESGLHVYFPRVERGIQFYEVNGPEDLVRGSWNIPEPKESCESLPLDSIFDLLVIPGVVFDKKGYRLGYGRGFYDKYLAETLLPPKYVVALAFDFQLVATLTPDIWDKKVNAIVTEKNILSISLDPFSVESPT